MKYLISGFAILACLTMDQALNIHCRLTCLSEGEYGGMWSKEEKSCLCFYVRGNPMPITAVLVKEKPKD